MKFFKHTIFAVALLCSAAFFFSSCGKEETSTSSIESQINLIQSFIKTTKIADSVKKEGDLWYNRFQKGTGVKIQTGDKVTLNYVLTVVENATTLRPVSTSIESVAKANKLFNDFTKYEPITVVVGRSGLPKGFDFGLSLLYEGDAAQLLFPSNMAYGGSAIGAIPSNSSIGVRVYISKVER